MSEGQTYFAVISRSTSKLYKRFLEKQEALLYCLKEHPADGIIILWRECPEHA